MQDLSERTILEEKTLRERDNKPSFWAWVKNWRVRGKRLDFLEHKWLVDLYKDTSQKIVVRKAAQMGLTERFLAESIYVADQLNANSLYLMPTGGAIGDMVQARVNPAILDSEYLGKSVGRQEGSNKNLDKVGLKRFGSGFWYGRGANTPKQVISVDADAIFVDERDRIDDIIMPYLPKRLQHSKLKLERWFSTPTIPDWGIDRMYYEGTQLNWNVKCPHCGTWQELSYGDNIDKENLKLVCRSCKKELKEAWFLDGKYVANNPEGKYNSYQTSQLYTGNLNVEELVEEMTSGNESRVTQAYNQILGLPYEPKGATITVEELYACRGEHNAPCKSEGKTFMGIDVGRVLHITIVDKEKRKIYIGTNDWEDLDGLMKDYKVMVCVIDALPETKAVSDFAKRHRGKVYACYYSNLKMQKNEYYKFNIGRIDANRTASLDAMVATIQNQEVILPKNLENYKEYISHFKNIKRIVIVKDEKTGEKEAKWVRVGDDHYAHSYNYALLASKKMSTLRIL